MNQIAKRNSAQLAIHGKLAELFGGAFQEQAADLTGGVSVGFPVLSIKGKVFHIKQGGEATLVTQPNSEDPATSLNVILLKANPHISKVYYENGYEEGADTKPTCYSNNGIAPEDDSEEKQSLKCATCPKNQWGSRITDNGKKGKACSDSRRVAVAPAGEPDNAMLLRVPAASLKPLMQYGKALSSRGVPYQAVITKLSFDHTVAHPLLKFAPAAALSEDIAETVFDTVNGEVVEAIINGGGAEQIAQELQGERDVEDEENFEQVAAAAREVQQKSTRPAATSKPKATAKPGAGVASADIAGIMDPQPEPEPEPQPEPPKATKPASAKPSNSAAASAAGGTPVDGNVDSMLGDLLKGFDDE